MTATLQDELIAKLRVLRPEQLAEVNRLVERLATSSARDDAFDRLLAIAPALEAAGVTPPNEAEIESEIDAVLTARRARRTAGGGADRP